MSDILSSSDSIAVNEGFAQNLISYFKHLAAPEHDSTQIEMKKIDTSILFNVDLTLPIFNGILIREDSDYVKVIEEFEPYYVENSLPYQIWLDPDLDKNDYVQKLKPFGFRYVGDEIGLVIDIEKMDKNLSYPNSLYIEEINSRERFLKYMEVVKLKFNYRGDAHEEYIAKFDNVDFKEKGRYWKKYIGWLNGEVQGVATLILGGGIAMIYEEALTTRLAKHPYGVNDGIVLKAMMDALKLGYNVGALFSTIGELRRYFAIGFQEKLKMPKFVKTYQRRARKR